MNDSDSDASDNEDANAKTKKKTKNDLDVAQIDAHWLSRELGRQYPADAPKCTMLAREIMSLLSQTKADVQKLEQALMELLEFENFVFARVLMQNRFRI